MQTVIELLHRAARRYGDLPYLGQKLSEQWTTFGFAAVDRMSAGLALAFRNLGFAEGDNVAILAEGQASWVIGEYALLKARCVSVPLSTKLTADEIRFRLDHAACRGVLASEGTLGRVVPVLRDMGLAIPVVGISPDSAAFRAQAQSLGLGEGKDFFLYDRLLEEGLARADAPEGQSELGDLESRVQPEDTVTICYTSGTTGNPKGIMLTHRNYCDNAEGASRVVQVETGWKSLIMLPLDHSFAHTVGIYVFALRGLCMYFVDSRGGPLASMRNLPYNLKETNPDFLLTVPALSGNFMKKMIQGVAEKGGLVNAIFQAGLAAGIRRAGNGWNKPSPWVRLAAWFPHTLARLLVFPSLRRIFGSDIRFCIGGGALLEVRQQEFFNAIGVPVYQGYGLTENSPIICSNSPGKAKFGTSGVIIPTLEVRIMKDDSSPAAPGEPGQIVTRGDSVMKGYYRNPGATAETLKAGWLWSGDLGYVDADGFLVVTGREKALLIAPDGEKYSPEVVEEAILNTSRLVSQVMVYNEQSPFTSALVTLDTTAFRNALEARRKGGEPCRPADLLEMIRQDLLAFRTRPEHAHIPAQWRPAAFVLLPEPFGEEHSLVNSTMKLVRHRVRDHYRNRIQEMYALRSTDPDSPGNLEALEKLGFGG